MVRLLARKVYYVNATNHDVWKAPIETTIYQSPNFCASDNERPIMIFYGKENREACAEIMDHLEIGNSYLVENGLHVTIDGCRSK